MIRLVNPTDMSPDALMMTINILRKALCHDFTPSSAGPFRPGRKISPKKLTCLITSSSSFCTRTC